MKSILTAAFVAIACSPVVASEPTVAPSTAPVEAPPAATITPAPITSAATSAAAEVSPATTATPSAPVTITPESFIETLPTRPANQNPSFCGQDMVYRLLAKTEVGKQLHLRQQEALRAAIAQAKAEGRIPPQQPQAATAAAAIPQPAQSAPKASAETTTPNVTPPQN